MKTSTVVVGSAVVMAIAATVVAVFEHWEARRLRAMFHDESAAWRADLERLKERIAELPAGSASSPGPVVTVAATPPDELENVQADRLAAERRYQQELAKQRAQEARALAELSQRVPFLPEMQRINLEHFRAGLSLRYGALYRALGLSGEQIAAFEALQAARFQAFADLLAAAQDQRLSRTDPVYLEMRERTMAPLDARLRETLGARAYEACLVFEQSTPTRALVESAAGKVAAAASPLTTAQIDRLGSILSMHASADTARSPADAWLEAQVFGQDGTRGAVSWTEIDWGAAEPALRQALSPDQFTALETISRQARLRGETAALRDELQRELRQQQQEAARVPDR